MTVAIKYLYLSYNIGRYAILRYARCSLVSILPLIRSMKMLFSVNPQVALAVNASIFLVHA